MDFLNEFIGILNMMSPYLLLGFLVSGLLHVYAPSSLFQKHLAGNNMKSVFWASLIGVPLPLCSCGVIPTAMSVKNEGASHGATVSFLISTPQTGVDSILATYGLLGLPYAICRPIFAFVLAMFGGMLVNLWGGEKNKTNNDNVPHKEIPSNKTWKDVFVYGFVTMIQNFGKWLVLGLLIAAAITAFIPPSVFELLSENYWLNILAVLAISIPMYVCATGSIPIALSLIAMGMSPGTAMILLIAGPATNVASITVIKKVLGTRTTLVYILSVVIGAILCALMVDLVFPPEWFALHNAVAETCHTHSSIWWQILSSILFVLLFVNAFVQPYLQQKKEAKEKAQKATTETPKSQFSFVPRKIYHVNGMDCNHCKANIERSLLQLPNVSFAQANIQTKTVEVEGSISADQVKKCVESLGFDFVQNVYSINKGPKQNPNITKPKFK